MKTNTSFIARRAETVKNMLATLLAVAALLILSGFMVKTASATMIVGDCAKSTTTDAPEVWVTTTCQPRPNPDPATLNSIDYQLNLTYDGYLDFANIGTQEGTLPASTESVFITADDGNNIQFLNTVLSLFIPETTILPNATFRALFNGTATAIGSIAPTDFIYFPGETFEIGASFDISAPDDVGDCALLNPVSCIFANDARMTVSLEGTFTYNYEQSNMPPTAVPAPATLALFGFGLAALSFSRRKVCKRVQI